MELYIKINGTTVNSNYNFWIHWYSSLLFLQISGLFPHHLSTAMFGALK
jgi:hypothetical protein